MMPSRRRVLLDTGPLVAYVNAEDEHHAWAAEILAELPRTAYTCEAVLTESWHLARHLAEPERLLDFLDALDLRLLRPSPERVRTLLRTYTARSRRDRKGRPPDYADMCLLALAEADDSLVVTVDRRDFPMYRLPNGEAVEALMPPA